ncbi:hypothetical protein DBR43_04765 [Pedobacter sp. KBW06]|uniref:hypothetical protein n=1 Tax=Pedobacter sp. KBW06 TaxID=2153359 RepID=UPI000F5B66EF|nr:hypothetical protein [Pedobacter sp. KBW06]RQO74701.1 hypothetical protein DBR43_04765 [Pedobacter sp. KBW06]
MKNKILILLLILLAGCKKNNNTSQPAVAEVVTTELSFDNDSNSKLMFQDGESTALLTAEARRYEIGKVLRVKAIDETTIEVANFAPVDIENATILLRIEGSAKPVRLFKIKKIRAHAVQEIKYPFINGTSQFLDIDHAPVDLSAYKTTGLVPGKVSFDFSGETELIVKLKKLAKLKWKVKYHDFDSNDNTEDNWKENIDAKDVRRFSGFIINLAYLLQANETRTSYVAEPITGNDGVTFLSTAEKETAFQKMIDIPQFNCGVVVNVSGLGGGYTFGVANHILNDYLNKDVCFIVVHEVSHMIGYNHDSTMTYPKNGKGATEACSRVYKQLLSANEFPIKKAAYYKQSDL